VISLSSIASEDDDAIVTDLDMGEISGLELCERILQQRTDVPVIVPPSAAWTPRSPRCAPAPTTSSPSRSTSSRCAWRWCVRCSTAGLAVDDLPETIRKHRAVHVLVTGDDPSELVPLEEVDRRYVLRVLQAVSSNKRLAARVLGDDRKTLDRKLERYGVSTS
jgi:DNA-binding NtrC family response regulator